MSKVRYGLAPFLVLCVAVAPAGASAPRLPRGPSGKIAVVHANQSTNWAGYVQGLLEKGTTFHRVSGDWTVPAATQRSSGREESSSAWIGIGGGCLDAGCSLTDQTLIQAGTEQDVASNGVASYYAWYEVIPLPALLTDLVVHAGDHMRGDINEILPGLWSITLTNVTTGNTFATTIPYTSTYGSVEWIVETPFVVGGGGTGFASMPNLSATTFTSAAANGGAAGLVEAERMLLVDLGGSTIATPSNPGSGSNKFNVCTYTTSCGAP